MIFSPQLARFICIFAAVVAGAALAFGVIAGAFWLALNAPKTLLFAAVFFGLLAARYPTLGGNKDERTQFAIAYGGAYVLLAIFAHLAFVACVVLALVWTAFVSYAIHRENEDRAATQRDVERQNREWEAAYRAREAAARAREEERRQEELENEKYEAAWRRIQEANRY
jgi:hypothetical protein